MFRSISSKINLRSRVQFSTLRYINDKYYDISDTRVKVHYKPTDESYAISRLNSIIFQYKENCYIGNSIIDDIKKFMVYINSFEANTFYTKEMKDIIKEEFEKGNVQANDIMFSRY